MVMFGLTVIAAAVLTLGATLAVPTAAANMSGTASIAIYGGSGWIAFLVLFVGWLAAIAGAASGKGRQLPAAGNVREVRDLRTAA
jgi:hypothetical protein